MTGDSGEVRVPVPDEYDDEQREAFLRGFGACADLFGTAAASYKAAVSRGEPQDEGEDECQECGSELLSSMGADESEYSPAGYVCPGCEL